MINKAVATFAIGKEYQKYALTLADSFLLYNHSNEIKFYIITDRKIILDKKYQSRITIIINENLLTGEDVLLNKIFIDEYITEDNILLVDADSLICKPLSPLFYLLRHEDIAIWGQKKQGEDLWKGDLQKLFEIHKINHVYGINGCLYYFKKNQNTEKFFRLTKKLASKYDENGFPRVYNNLKDDEIVIAVVCSKLAIPLRDYDSRVKAEKMYYSRKHINLFLGKCKLYYSNYEFEQNNSLLESEANPMILCLDRRTVSQFDYKMTAFLLRKFLVTNNVCRVLIAIIYTALVNFYYLVKYTKWNIANLYKKD